MLSLFDFHCHDFFAITTFALKLTHSCLLTYRLFVPQINLVANCYISSASINLYIVRGRYEDDRHLGSLRSPLRVDASISRMGRHRGLRNADRTRSSQSEARRRGVTRSHTGHGSENNSHDWQLDRSVVKLSFKVK